jgi:hypothetical protein
MNALTPLTLSLMHTLSTAGAKPSEERSDGWTNKLVFTFFSIACVKAKNIYFNLKLDFVFA